MRDFKPNKIQLSVWTLGGGYLTYLAYTLIRSGTENTGWRCPVYIIIGILFVAAGIFLLVNCIRFWKQMKEDDKKLEEEIEREKLNPKPEEEEKEEPPIDPWNMGS